MRVPQVNERVKEAPAQALRAMFAGIGQLLLITDRFRSRSAEEEAGTEKELTNGASTAVAVTEEAASAEPAAEVTPSTEPEAEPAAEAAEPAAPEAEPAAAPVVSEEVKASPAAEAAPAPVGEVTVLPLPNYDELTVPSLRARLRNLSADQLTQLIDYEKTHAERPEVISMFERRIAKLAEG